MLSLDKLEKFHIFGKTVFAYIHIQEHIERFIYSNVSKGIFPTIMSAVIFLGIIFESAVSYFFSAECN